MYQLKDYEGLVGSDLINQIKDKASDLEGKSFVHVNSTYYGGGVAEMLNSYVPLMNDAGVNMEWRLLKGSRDFFFITKKLHNALQGRREVLSDEETEVFEKQVEANSKFMNLKGYDCVIIDDPQPCPLINHYPRTSPAMWKPLPLLLELETFQRKQPWVWRAHIDLTTPQPAAMNYLKKFISKYDLVIVSQSNYGKKIKKRKKVIYPAIDPLSDKNRPLKSYQVENLLKRIGIDTKLPIIAQVSRFDRWKDPVGVINAFRLVRKKVPCQLVLLGNQATDDPEAEKIFSEVFRIAEKEKDIILVSQQSDLLVNALQREAAVIIQKSIREGFGLTVSEALWKGTPVVATNVGGIPLQIDEGKNGFLINNGVECAKRIEYLLKNPKIANEMGERGKEKVREKFLIPRLVLEELNALEEVTRISKTVKPPLSFQKMFEVFKKAPRVFRKGFKLFTPKK